jgi:hypothetical protein
MITFRIMRAPQSPGRRGREEKYKVSKPDAGTAAGA